MGRTVCQSSQVCSGNDTAGTKRRRSNTEQQLQEGYSRLNRLLTERVIVGLRSLEPVGWSAIVAGETYQRGVVRASRLEARHHFADSGVHLRRHRGDEL